MIKIKPSFIEINNIPTIWTTEANKNGILISQCKGNNAFSCFWITIIIETIDNFFFNLILIRRINDTIDVRTVRLQMFITALNV